MYKKKLLLIGKNSFIAKNFLSNNLNSKFLDITSISHDCLPKTFANYDYVLNLAFNPFLYDQVYKEEYDHDLKILRINHDDKIAKKEARTKFIFLSSRSVYGSTNKLIAFNEKSSPIGYISNYGYNKITIEKNVKEYLDCSNFLILRSSNILGSQYGGRNFMGIASESLVKNKKIILNVSKKVVRDFIPIDIHSKILTALIINNKQEVFNIGSGIGIEIGDICNSLIKGFGEGTIEDSNKIKDQYILDSTKALNYLDDKITKENILIYTYEIGKLLKKYTNNGI